MMNYYDTYCGCGTKIRPGQKNCLECIQKRAEEKENQHLLRSNRRKQVTA